MTQKVKAVKDESGHWYVIPNELSEKFDDLIDLMNEDEDIKYENEFFDMFNKYRTGGDLNLIQLYADI